VLVLASLVCHFFVDSRPEYQRPGEWFFSIFSFIIFKHITKGQLISKCLWCLQIDQKNNEGYLL
jgi:hypothetical protein